jgi:hypothetical protein
MFVGKDTPQRMVSPIGAAPEAEKKYKIANQKEKYEW